MESPYQPMTPKKPTAPPEGFDARVTALASLGDPVRRGLFRYVVAQGAPVNREEAAAAAGVTFHVAKFHLDKLADAGLLETEYSRPPGRGGPGAGRPAKHYRRSSRPLEVSVPERRYDLAGRLLAQAVTTAQHAGVPVGEALVRAARDMGKSMGIDARTRAGPRPSRRALVAAARDALEERGYEPRSEGGDIDLANCPFHALAQDYTELVCGMNLELMSGMTAALGHSGLDACLEPGPERCCVRLRERPRARPKARATER